jgi:hypothetical protein
MEIKEFCTNQEVVIKPKFVKRPCWKGLAERKAKIISVHTKAVVVELVDNGELFVLQKKDIKDAYEENQ